MRSISGRLAVILTAGFSLMACKAPVTVTFPTNGEVSKDPVVSVTLRFDSWFVSQPYDGLYLDGTPYVWADFKPPPAAGGTSSLSGACPEYASTKVSVGIGYTCGTLCTAGIPAFTFQPPHFTMESEQTTTNDLTFNSAGNWTTYSVSYVVGTNIAAPSSAIDITIKDVTPGGPATELCATAPAPGCAMPATGISVTISPPGSSATFYVNATSPKHSHYTLQATACGCAIGTVSGKIK